MHSKMTSDSIMTRKVRPRSSPEFKVECTLFMIGQGYSVRDAAQAIGVGKTPSASLVVQLAISPKFISDWAV